MSSMAVHAHSIRYGFSGDQYLLALFPDGFDQLVLNAKIVAHMGAGLSAFLLGNLLGKPYVIDPQTYSFQHDRSYLESSSRPGSISSTFLKLIDAYGPPIDRLAEKLAMPIEPSDLANPSVLKPLCKRVLRFQREALTRKPTAQDAAKYIRFAERAIGRKIHSLGPSLLVPPYFFLEELSWREWLGVNTRAVAVAKEERLDTDPPIAAQVVLSRGTLLDELARAEIARAYASVKPEAFLLWIDSYQEHEVAQPELGALADLVLKLMKTARVINLYGGYFSVLLMRAGLLSDVTHGLEYGEDRAVLPIGGGVASARFYMPSLHLRMLHRDAVRVVRGVADMSSKRSFHARICDCPQCQKTIQNPDTDFALYGQRRPGKDGKPYPTARTRDLCAKHYLHSKRREYESGLTLAESIDQLETSLDELESKVDSQFLAHLARWAAVLRSL